MVPLALCEPSCLEDRGGGWAMQTGDSGHSGPTEWTSHADLGPLVISRVTLGLGPLPIGHPGVGMGEKLSSGWVREAD